MTTELLTNDEMRRADRLTIEAGTPGIELMRRAGEAVGRAALSMGAGRGPVAIICGPGNNGGDGFVAARFLQEQGLAVRVALLGDRSALGGDAALAAAAWGGEVASFAPDLLQGASLVVDALFGSGLARDIDGAARRIVDAINASGLPVLAVDVPSGVDGDSGRVRGCAIRASRTVTFLRRKPGHLLLPGRALCGEIACVDIGIAAAVLAPIAPRFAANGEELWHGDYPVPAVDTHKYRRGHAAVVSGGPFATGAARLAARGALRIGAGLVSLVSPAEAASINAAHLTAIMLRVFADDAELAERLADRRINAVLIGPGAGVGEATRRQVATVLAAERAVVLDADALTSFADTPDGLFAAIAGRARPVVVTPHDGEFARLFADYAGRGDRLDKALFAARRSGAVVVLKGPDTVVAAPSGQAAINVSGSPWLATAGSGDVLAGMITGLLAQGMPAFGAAAAAAHLHGLAARRFGAGLIAEDIAELLPQLIATMLTRWQEAGAAGSASAL